MMQLRSLTVAAELALPPGLGLVVMPLRNIVPPNPVYLELPANGVLIDELNTAFRSLAGSRL